MTRRPEAIVIAGANGAGKTTFARERGIALFSTVYKPLVDRWYHWFSDERGLRLGDQQHN